MPHDSRLGSAKGVTSGIRISGAGGGGAGCGSACLTTSVTCSVTGCISSWPCWSSEPMLEATLF
jgi:hypothetical protein